MKEAPNSKLQAPKKLQTSNSKRKARAILKLGFWNFSGAWSLEIGTFLVSLVFLLATTRLSSAQETEVQFLSGHGKDDAVPWKFFCTSGANSGFWTNLPVPSQWDVKGFGTVNYHKDLTNGWNEKGLYAHDFTVSSNWKSRRVFIVFDGVMTDTEVKLNGQSAGPVHQGGFYRFKYEITSLLNF